MMAFRNNYYELTKSDDVASLLGSMSLMKDGSPADSAIADDWRVAITKILGGSFEASFKLK